MHGSARLPLLTALAALSLLAGPGCTRKFFRNCADEDVAGVITQKNKFPDWVVRNWYVYPNPMARFADPYNPDRPPYPPDDFAARVLSPNPQHPTKKTGVGRVDGEGYLTMLAAWDAENRGVAPGPLRSGPPDVLFIPRVLPDTVVAGGTSPWSPANVAPAVGPRVVEIREPVVPAGGIDEPGDKTVPAVATADLPTGSPERLPPPASVDGADGQPDGPPQPREMSNAQFPTLNVLLNSPDTDSSYLRALLSNQQGFRIRVQQAVELGLVNSREFQDRREDLYLAALPVTLERWNFAAQAFFAENVIRRSVGMQLPGGGQFWEIDTNTGFRKLFPTGAQLMVQLANQVVIDLGSNKPTIAISNFTLSLMQPFLRGGGFAVNLENLTQTERNMLYAMRSYARFRKLFYVATVAGPASNLGLTNNPYGLQGLSTNLGRGVGANLTAPVVGFLPMLQQLAIIGNQIRNVAALEQLYRQYEAFKEGGQVADLQVAQVETQLLTSRASLLGSGVGNTAPPGSLRGYLDALDNFKLQLGLPLTVGLDLDDAQLKPIREQLARFDQVYAQLRQLEDEARRFDPKLPADQYRARWLRLFTESALLKGTPLAQGIGDRWGVWAKLTDDQLTARLAALRKERGGILDRRADRQRLGQPEPPDETRRLAEVESEIDLALFERTVRVYEARPWLKEKGPTAAGIQASAFQDMFNGFYQLALEGRNQRLDQTRHQWPALPALPVGGTDVLTASLDEGYTAGIQAALSDRLDLMNARGQVVDAYRQIAVQANSLQGVFNVQYDLNAATPNPGALPFGFGPGRTAHTLTLHGELPLARRAERNNYRASLISYQRQRRTLMAFEDNIANDIRGDIRQLRTLAELYKIQQRVVELGYSQVDNARETFFAPLAANQVLDAAASAALTQQLLQAQSNLLSAQNTLYTYWVSYLTARMSLYLDLELMQIDERGVWSDEQNYGTDTLPRPDPQRGPAERLPAPEPVGPADRK